MIRLFKNPLHRYVDRFLNKQLKFFSDEHKNQKKSEKNLGNPEKIEKLNSGSTKEGNKKQEILNKTDSRIKNENMKNDSVKKKKSENVSKSNPNKQNSDISKKKIDKAKLNKKEEEEEAPTGNQFFEDREKFRDEKNHAIIYFPLNLSSKFDLFQFRKYLFSFIYTKQKEGKLYLNVLDSASKMDIKEKEKDVEQFLKLIDWLGLEFDFDPKFKKIIYESNRISHYNKYSKYLLAQRDAYQCFCEGNKCVKQCENSVENSDYNLKTVFDNKDLRSIKVKPGNKPEIIKEIISSESFEINPKNEKDFNIYTAKKINESSISYFSSTFKRVIDDELFGITHKFEVEDEFNINRHVLLTKLLDFKNKSYALLPKVKIASRNPNIFLNYDIEYLKSKYILPESIINESILLGWRFDSETEMEKIKNKDQSNLVLQIGNIINEVDINMLKKENCDFDDARLLFLNNKHLQIKYIESDIKYRNAFQKEFRSTLIQLFPENSKEISNWSDRKFHKLVRLIMPFIDTFENISKRYAFLFSEPIFSFSFNNKKVLKLIFTNKDFANELLDELIRLLEKIIDFESKVINREIGVFLFKKNEVDKRFNNENAYGLLKFALTGDVYGPFFGEIAEFLGKNSVIQKLKAFSIDNIQKKFTIEKDEKVNKNRLSTKDSIKAIE